MLRKMRSGPACTGVPSIGGETSDFRRKDDKRAPKNGKLVPDRERSSSSSSNTAIKLLSCQKDRLSHREWSDNQRIKKLLGSMLKNVMDPCEGAVPNSREAEKRDQRTPWHSIEDSASAPG